jgi:hypothetical protein
MNEELTQAESEYAEAYARYVSSKRLYDGDMSSRARHHMLMNGMALGAARRALAQATINANALGIELNGTIIWKATGE